jgi:L-asparagine oxygenase
MESFCEMVAYEAEGYGRLFQDVVPTQSMAEQQTSLGSRKELEIHTEQAFSELRPDFISLACLRGDSHALTYVLPVTKIVEAMDSEDIALLRQPLWNTGVDLSFKLGGYEFIEGDIRGPMPILTGSSDDPRLRFDQDLMFGLEERAHGLVGKIVDIYYQSRYEHCLLPGEIMWVDNRRAVHGRSPFFPRYDGKDRFLVRCFGVVGDLKDMTLGMGFDDGRRCIPAIYS